MIARYALSDQSASFEFFPWLVLVQAMGATEIVIDPANPKTSKIPVDEIRERVRNILWPGATLAGLPVRIGQCKPQISARAPELFAWSRAGKSFKRLRSVRPPQRAKFTVTLRRERRAKNRNSDETAWRQFASEIGAYVIEDYAIRPIELYERMALYAGAQMNFGVCNGPMAMVSLSPYPMTMFARNASSCNSLIKSGVPHGQQFPWALPWQKIIWREDSLENLRAAMPADGAEAPIFQSS